MNHHRQDSQKRISWIPLLVGLGLAGIAVLVLVATLLGDELFPEPSPSHRGFQVAVKSGCFSCHGVGNTSGAPNPAKGPKSPKSDPVPSLFGERHPIEELRQWIENGVSDRKRDSQAYLAARDQKALKMPAYKERLSAEEIDDLIAFVALSQYRRASSDRVTGSTGERIARRFACFTCHGELGQGGVENPGSLKGYIPGFFGNDFRALTNNGDPEDVRQWILNGKSDSFWNQGFAGFYPGRYFTERQAIRMPAYKDFVNQDELDKLVEYVLEVLERGPLTAESLVAYRPLTSDHPEEHGHSGEAGLDSLESQGLFKQAAEILEANCVRCHGPVKSKSSFRLDRRDRALRGGEIAEFLGLKAIDPGTDEGLLLKFITATEEDPDNETYPMPPGDNPRLTGSQIETLRQWILEGVQWPPGVTLKPVETATSSR